MNKVLILGGGLGGLFTGALLAQEGCRVTILERQTTPGGGLQQFSRHGRSFGTGMHVLGGLGPEGSLHRLCAHLGIADRFATRPCDAVAEVVLADGTHYQIPTGRETQTAWLKTQFPTEAEGIEHYEAALRALTDSVGLFRLERETSASPFDFNEELLVPADRFVARYVRDPRLQQLLQFADLLYDARPGHTPAYVHAVVTSLYRNNTEMPIVGAPSLADALAGVIRQHGGEVLCGVNAGNFESEGRHLKALTATDGRTWSADVFVSAIAPTSLLALLPDGTMPAAFTRRVQQIPTGISAFKVFYDLKPEAFPYIDHPTYIYDKTAPELQADANTGEERIAEPSFMDRWMFVTPPVTQQGPWAGTLEVVCPMPFADAEAWSDSVTGHRPADYEAWKQHCIETVTDRLEQMHPGFRNAVRHAFAATPLTWRDWTCSPRGAMYGTLKDCQDPALARLSVRTKVDNLYLTGQCVHLHGICGTPLTALLTAEAIVGKIQI